MCPSSSRQSIRQPFARKLSSSAIISRCPKAQTISHNLPPSPTIAHNLPPLPPPHLLPTHLPTTHLPTHQDFPANDEPQTGFIDVWWIKHDGGLLLLISHLLQKHRVWRRCGLRLHLITEVGTDPVQLKARIHKLLNRINITATVEEV